MFDVTEYLSKLEYQGPVEPTAEVLRELQKRHLMLVPFDSAHYAGQGMTVLANADIDVDEVFDVIIRGGRGGACYDLNGLFRRLLEEIGFDVMLMSAGMPGPGGTWGLDIEHMFQGVRLDGQLWLVDVGYPGPSYIEPIRFTREVQEQYGSRFRLVEREGYEVLERQSRSSDWAPIYRFQVVRRELSEWLQVTGTSEEDGWNWEGVEVAAGTIIRGRTFERGQMILIGRRLTTVEDGEESVRTLVRKDDYEATLRNILLQDA